SDYIRITFNDEVSYSNGGSRNFYLRNNYWTYQRYSHFLNHPRVVGMYVGIDLERTRCENSNHYFGSSDSVIRLSSPMEMRETMREAFPVMDGGAFVQFLMDTNEYFNEIAQARERQSVAAEYSR